MSDLRKRLLENSTIKETEILKDSRFLNDVDVIPTAVPMINVALSGRLDGGLTSGLTIFAGPSRHFKTGFVLMCVKAYLEKYKEAVCLFYDSEFGSPQDYFQSFDIDVTRVIHTPITDVEQLKHDIMAQLAGIKRGDKVIIVTDSIGNLASKKEVDDALEGKSTVDMTRAKQFKSLGRMVTPHLTIKDIPWVCVGHTYSTMELYSKQVLSGGTGMFLSADTIFILGRQQEKEGTEVLGYNFIMNIEKSRFVREKAKIPVKVLFEGGISRWSGLLDVALASGHVVKPTKGWYSRAGEEKKYREADTFNKSFWIPILQDETFRKWVETHYALGSSSLLSEPTDEDIEREYENAE
jgi:RecA/RadA recombinase